MSFSGKKVLITGGLGFIGSTLARHLLDLGAEITLVDSLIPEYGGNLSNVEGFEDRLKINFSDIRDRFSLPPLVKGQDYIFSLAGQTSHMDSMTHPQVDLDINCSAQLALLEACRTHNPGARVVFASTRQLYGKPRYLPVDEEHPVAPVDINGVHKLAGEQYYRLYHEVYGLRTSILRLTNVIGPRMRIKDARQTFIGIWIRLLVEGKPFEVWGGDQLRDFLDVEDVVRGFSEVAEKAPGEAEIFNAGGGGPISLLDLAQLCIEVNGRGSFDVREFPEDRKKIDIGDFYSDSDKLFNSVGWKPRLSLAETLERSIRYYREKIELYL